MSTILNRHQMISQLKFAGGQNVPLASQVALVVKNLPANAEDGRDKGSIPGLGRSSGGGHCNPLQCFCLETPIDRGAWWDTVHASQKAGHG